MNNLLLKNLFAFAGLAVALSPVCLAQAQLAGDWQGALDVNGTPIRIAWHVFAGADGTVTSTFDNLDEAIYGIKVKSLSLKGTDLNLAVDDTVQINGQDTKVSGTLVGTVNKDATELTGTFTQTEPQSQPPAQLHLTHGPAQAASAGRGQMSIAGDWAGTLSAGGAELRLVVHISAAKDGTFTATMDSLDQGTATVQSPDQSPLWAPATSVTRAGDKLTIEMKAFGASFEGTINAAKDTVDGTFSQGGGSLPLVLKKN